MCSTSVTCALVAFGNVTSWNNACYLPVVLVYETLHHFLTTMEEHNKHTIIHKSATGIATLYFSMSRLASIGSA